jgi:hypothetical protein
MLASVRHIPSLAISWSAVACPDCIVECASDSAETHQRDGFRGFLVWTPPRESASQEELRPSFSNASSHDAKAC